MSVVADSVPDMPITVTIAAILPVAPEHIAFCPDNIWQGARSLTKYARHLAGINSREFWWD